MNQPVTIDQVLEMTKQLSVLDKVRLIEQITPQITRDLKTIRTKSRKSLRGLWRGTNITSAEIDEARRELWNNFPRNDL
jgi:hypothetical protein